MSKPIYIVGGSKGGVGKSIVSMALINYLRGRNEKVVLIETDTSNPDVAKCYQSVVTTELTDLDNKEGWMELVDICGAHEDCVIVVNTAARNNDGVAAYGRTLMSTLPELNRKLVTLWVINWQKDSLELLSDYLAAVPNGELHVLKNAYFGADSKYERYNKSEIGKVVENRGGKARMFPDVADRVSEQLYSERIPIEVAAKEMTIGNRAELRRWLECVNGLFDEIIAK